MNPSRGIVIAGNWKMNSLPSETDAFFSTLKKRFHEWVDPKDLELFHQDRIRVALCPPYLSLERAHRQAGHLMIPIRIASQNTHWNASGPFTGEISGPMLNEIGIQWSLVGHSERRQYFGETDLTAQKRTESLLKQGFQVILCIGETQQERQNHQTETVLTQQLEQTVGMLKPTAFPQELQSRLILAYEPVWAIGTGLTATPQQAQEAHHFIRQEVERLLDSEVANSLSILYGGSVTPENIDALLACSDVDGALVGGASLKPESFLALLAAGCRSLQLKA